MAKIIQFPSKKESLEDLLSKGFSELISGVSPEVLETAREKILSHSTQYFSLHDFTYAVNFPKDCSKNMETQIESIIMDVLNKHQEHYQKRFAAMFFEICKLEVKNAQSNAI